MLPILLRTVFCIMYGAANSEVLFGNQRPVAFIQDAGTWVVYSLMLCMANDLVIRFRMGYRRVLLLGAGFGVVMEGWMTGMVGEGGGMLVILMLWHALFTVCLTVMTADVFFPRSSQRPLPRPALIVACILNVLLIAVFFATLGWQGVVKEPLASLAGILWLGGTALWLGRARPVAGVKPRLWLILALTALGFGLGLLLIDIENEDPLKVPFAAADHAWRAAFYASMALAVLCFAVRKKQLPEK